MTTDNVLSMDIAQQETHFWQVLKARFTPLPCKARFAKGSCIILFLPEHKYVGMQLHKIIGWDNAKYCYIVKNLYSGVVRSMDKGRLEDCYSLVKC